MNRRNSMRLRTYAKVFTRAFTTLRLRIKKHPWRAVLLGFAGIALVFMAIVSATISWALSLPIPTFGELQNRYGGESTKLYDRTGTILLYDTSGLMRRTTVSLENVSPHLIGATIAIEDDSFYEHEGVRPDAIVRALFINLRHGAFVQGGSTITQQVIKNTLLTKDKSLSRKLKEWVLALRIEGTYTKDEILMTYLNETPYGGTMYGAEEASRAYFGKPAKELTLSEAAYLAALPKAPTHFSPWGNNLEALKQRHNVVLSNMLTQGFITDEQYNDAMTEDVVFAERSNGSIKAPHFAFYVLEELEEKYGKETVYGGALKVITTLDWELQQESEEIIREGALQNEKKFRASNAGLVALDPRTGQVLAMVGSRDYFDDSVDGQVNVAVALRQPGSAFKPIVYATAFKKGYTPDTVLFDLKTQFSTACAESNFSNELPCYSPENYDEKYRGPMTLRDALAQSVNIVGVKVLCLAGIKESMNTARQLGITTLKDSARYGLTLVLGGGEVTLLEMTGAYGVFANDGVRHPTTPVLSVRTAGGKVLESYESKPEQVLEPEVARTINDVLSDNEARIPAFGPASPLYFGNTLVASKTGTTNDYRDAWVIGYTPNIVVGTWAGNNDNTPMEKSVSAFILAPMWHAAMEKALTRFPFPPFQYFARNEPAASSTLQESGLVFDPTNGIHEVLYWANKNSPGALDVPDSFNDPQISRWGYPVLLWAVNQASTTLALGVGGPDGEPLVMAITDPSDGESVRVDRPFTVHISHSEIKNVLRVSYYLNGIHVGDTQEPPFSYSMIAEEKGTAEIRAVAESPLGDSETVVTVNVGDSSRPNNRQERASN